MTKGKQNWYHLVGHLLHISIQNVKNFLTMPMDGTSSKYGIPNDFAFVKRGVTTFTLAHILHVPIPWQSKWPHFELASCWTLSKHFQWSHILRTCQPSYYIPTKTLESRPAWMIYSWTCMPSSKGTTLPHTFNTPTKLRKFGYTLSYYICQNSFNNLCPFPHFMCPNIMAFKWLHLKMASYSTFSKHLPCSHTLHTCQTSHSPQRYLNPIRFEWFNHEHTNLLQRQLQ